MGQHADHAENDHEKAQQTQEPAKVPHGIMHDQVVQHVVETLGIHHDGYQHQGEQHHCHRHDDGAQLVLLSLFTHLKNPFPYDLR